MRRLVVGNRTETKTQNILKFYSSAKKSEWPKTWEGFVLKGKAKEHVDSATGNVIPVRSHTPCWPCLVLVPAFVWLPSASAPVPSGEGAHRAGWPLAGAARLVWLFWSCCCALPLCMHAAPA